MSRWFVEGDGRWDEGRAMSLLRIRRERKMNWIDMKTGWSPRRLVVLLIALLAAIWYLGFRF